MVSPRNKATGSAQIVVEQTVMLDHGGDAGVVDQRRPERPETEERPPARILAAPRQQLQRSGREEQTLHRGFAHLHFQARVAAAERGPFISRSASRSRTVASRTCE